MSLHLIRHAEALSAESSDPMLSPRGVVQARRLGQVIKNEGVERIVHGPARRARHTAELLAAELGSVELLESNLAKPRSTDESGRVSVP